ncbi:MAG TPA: pyruvate kinase [Candidatus Acidoferrales bacterium]|nr:pyruvate kinase [Candidatus Acidoferrales bacterium]
MTFRRSKIVCTLGPASRSPAMIDRMMRAGMDVARLNFSHGTHAEHAQAIARVREASGRLEKPIAILADLQGPKIRTGPLAGGKPVLLRAGQTFTLTTRPVLGNASCVTTTFRGLPREVHKGDRILLADGLIELRALHTHRDRVLCEVVNGGELGEHKGINLPGVNLHLSGITPKDRKDLVFALSRGVNYVAVSFVRRAEDVLAAKAAIRHAGRDTPVIAKLEKPEAIENLDEILRVADGVMVARGDLGVEMSPERVPVVQKQIIARALEFRRPVITATQMLESMTQNPRPTRAEASDVANAIFDGSDAVMLSAETAMGRYPLESVQMMARIIREAEAGIQEFPRPKRPEKLNIAETTSELITHASDELHMKVIAVFTTSGSTAKLISRHRPRAPIVAFTPQNETRRRLSLVWGVLPRSIAAIRDIDSLAAIAEKRLLEEKLVRRGDVIGIVAGTPMGIRGTTNFMKFHVIGGPTR